MNLAGPLARLAARLVAALHGRLEMAALDLQDGLLGLVQRLALALLAALLAALALAAAAATVVVVFWDSARLAALVGVTVLFAAACVATLWAMRHSAVRRGPLLAATLQALQRDLDVLRGHR